MTPEQAQTRIDQIRSSTRNDRIHLIDKGIAVGAFVVIGQVATQTSLKLYAEVWSVSTALATGAAGLVYIVNHPSKKQTRLDACVALLDENPRKAAAIMLDNPYDRKLWARGLQFVFSHGELFEPTPPGQKPYGVQVTDEIVDTLMSNGRGRIVRAIAANPIDLTTATSSAAEIMQALAYGAVLGKRTANLSLQTAREALPTLERIDPTAHALVASACDPVIQRQLVGAGAR